MQEYRLFKIVHHIGDDKYEICKITFDAEPKDYEVYGFVVKIINMPVDDALPNGELVKIEIR